MYSQSDHPYSEPPTLCSYWEVSPFGDPSLSPPGNPGSVLPGQPATDLVLNALMMQVR